MRKTSLNKGNNKSFRALRPFRNYNNSISYQHELLINVIGGVWNTDTEIQSKANVSVNEML